MNQSEYQRLIEQNQELLNRFATKGVRMDEAKDFDFRVSLPTSDDCRALRKALREKKLVPKDALLAVLSYRTYAEFSLSIEMVPLADSITEIEALLIDASQAYPDAEVSWEFRGC